MPGGNRFDSFDHQPRHALGGLQRVGAGALENGERDRRIVIEIGVRRIVERGEFDPGDILQAHHRARRLLHHDRAELVRVGEPAERLHRDLERAGVRDRRLVEHAGSDLDVLPLQRAGDVGGGQPERLQPVGIEPDAHRIVAAAEHGDRADAVDAGERVGHFERGVIGDEQRVARLVRRIKVHDHHQVGRGLADGDADVAHVGRQARLRDRDAVLHLHLRDVEIGAEVEADLDGEAPVGGRVRRHVEHVLDAVDLLLDRRDHGRGDDLGAGAGILAGDVDDRRRDLGILRDRQTRESDTPPRITKMIETTAAKIGRSMKKCEMRIYVQVSGRGNWAPPALQPVRYLRLGRAPLPLAAEAPARPAP